MLRLPEFNYIQPRSLKQATKTLADLGSDAMLIAGGTDVYPKMKRGQFTPRHLISLRGAARAERNSSEQGRTVDRRRGKFDRSFKSSSDRETFSRSRPRRGIRLDAAAAEHGNHRRQCFRRHPLQLLRSDFFLAPSGGFLHEKGRPNLSGCSRQLEVPGDRVFGHCARSGKLGSGSDPGKSQTASGESNSKNLYPTTASIIRPKPETKCSKDYLFRGKVWHGATFI